MPLQKFKENIQRKRKPSHDKSGVRRIIPIKSYGESSKSFVSPDFADKSTWFWEAQRVDDEVATTSDNTIYNFASGEDTIINLNKITDRTDYPQHAVAIKKNDSIITSGFSLNLSAKTIIFDSANDPGDTIKVSYSKENGSKFELVAASDKKILLDYVETQFSAGSELNDPLVFELILNNASTGNNDAVVAYTEYRNAHDYLNKGNHGTILKAFGGLTADVNVFPWNYLTGFIIKPVGDNTTDPTKNEFNKIRMYLKNNIPYTNCEIATGTFYCIIEDL